MEVDAVDTDTSFDLLKDNWELVHAQDPEADYFLSWRWLAQVFRANPGRWRVLAVRPGEDQGGYVCFLPLRLKVSWSTSRQQFQTEIDAAGRLSWAQYTGFVCLPEWEETALAAVGEQLRTLPWSYFKLKNCSSSDRRIEWFLHGFEEADYEVSYSQALINDGTVDNLECPFITLPADFDTYLQTSVSANTRQKIRRFWRRTEQSADLRFTVTAPEEFDRNLNLLIELWLRKWTPVRGRDVAQEIAAKYREILTQSRACNAVFLPVLWRNQLPLGALAHIVDHDKKRMFFIAAGRDEEASDPFIGLLLHAYSIRWAIENGISVYDLCHGNEPYKYSLGGQGRRIKRLVIRRRSHVAIARLDPCGLRQALDLANDFVTQNRMDDAAAACRQLRELCA
jgi:hypothetical protein